MSNRLAARVGSPTYLYILLIKVLLQELKRTIKQKKNVSKIATNGTLVLTYRDTTINYGY